MNMLYLPCSSYQAGLATSAAIWNLTRGGTYQNETTQYLYPIVLDVNSAAWAYVDIDSQIPVPAGSNGSNLLAAIQAAITAGVLQSSDLTSIQSAIAAAQGNTVTISSLLPPDLIAQGQTGDQMIANSLFVNTPLGG